MNIITLSLQDFFTKRMLSYAIIPFIVTLLVLNLLFFYTTNQLLSGFDTNSTLEIHQSSQTIDTNGVMHNSVSHASYSGVSIIDSALEYLLSSSIFAIVIYIFGSLFVFIFAIFVALFVIAFLTPYIVRDIHQKHYRDYPISSFSNTFSALLYTLKTALIALLLLIFFIPLYFVPIVNILAFNFVFYYMFHKLLSYDVATNIFTKERYKEIKYFYTTKIRLHTLGLFILSLIPFAILFTPIFLVIYMTHLFIHLDEKRKLSLKKSLP